MTTRSGRRSISGSYRADAAGVSNACSDPNVECDVFPFHLDYNTTVDVQLSWNNETNAFNLTIEDDNGTPAAETNTSTAASRRINVSLAPGDYRVRVVGETVTEDRYILEVVFDSKDLIVEESPLSPPQPDPPGEDDGLPGFLDGLLVEMFVTGAGLGVVGVGLYATGKGIGALREGLGDET